MAIAAGSKASRYNYARAATFPAIFSCVVASFGGFLFGYDLGITGGIASMETFQETFFPSVYAANHGPHKFVQTSPYCKFDSNLLQFFTSSMYLAGFFSALVASYLARARGRRFCMMLAGCCYIIGAVLTTAAPQKENALAMILVGRIMLGTGIGFANASVTVYAGEMSPPKYRGGLVLLFQGATTFGILAAQLINYGTATYEKAGWRISFSIAAIPAIMLLVGAIFLPETPSWLLAQDRIDESRKVLQKIRGSEDVEAELNDMIVQTRRAKSIKRPMLALLTQRCYLPYLTVSVVIAIVHQLSGSNAINFYGPQIFKTLSHGRQAALLNTVILGGVKFVASIVGILIVDRLGRRNLLLYGGMVMVSTAIICGTIMGYYFHNNEGKMPHNVGNAFLAMMCIFLAAYESSWGPLAWLIPAEIQPAEVRTAGNSIGTSVNMLFGFITGQTFLSMMCAWHFWVFIFFACIVSFGIVFVLFLLPECKGLEIEEVHEAFTKHWLWGRCPAPPREFALPEVALANMKNQVDDQKAVAVKKLPE